MIEKGFYPGRFTRWLVLASAVGVMAGLVAVLYQYLLEIAVNACLEKVIGLVSDTPIYNETGRRITSTGELGRGLLVLVPALGGLAVGLLVWLVSGQTMKLEETDEIVSYRNREGRYPVFTPFFNIMLSLVTLGTGGSGGKEGPAGNAGAACASILSRIFKLDSETRRILMIAGVAAGIGAIFRIPFSAALFASGFLYASGDVRGSVLIPASVASVISYSVFSVFYGFDPLLAVAEDYKFLSLLELVPYGILGLVAALAGYLFVRTYDRTGAFFSGLKIPGMLKPAIGGLLTGCTGLILLLAAGNDPSRPVLAVMSDGFSILQGELSSATAGVVILLCISLGKMLTTSFTLKSGGVAGLFTPSMVIGGTLGGACGLIFNRFSPGLVPVPTSFLVVGMSAYFCAVSNAPICSIVIACEVTGNYRLLLPAMWACSIAFLACRGWSIYPAQFPSLQGAESEQPDQPDRPDLS